MRTPRKVLLVGSGAARAEAIDALRAGGFRVTSACSFEEAADLIVYEPPDVLVTELRLGAFNGLHLIIRLQRHAPNAQAVVYTMFPDLVLERQAYLMGADYLVDEGYAGPLLQLLAHQTENGEDRRDSWRKTVVQDIGARVASEPALLVNISRGGFCIEVRQGHVESPIKMTLPDHAISVSAQIVWACRIPHKLDGLRLGARVSGPSTGSDLKWRRLFDSA